MAKTKVITPRMAAKAAGLKRYPSDVPCKNGHHSERMVSNRGCIECAAAWPERNREWVNGYARSHRAANPGKAALASAKHNAANRDARNAASRARYAADPKKGRTRVACYRIRNPDASHNHYLAHIPQAMEKARRRRARKNNAEGTHTQVDIDALYVKQKGKCIACLCRLNKSYPKYEVDHRVALFNGGSDWPSNLQIMCRACNRSKRAKDMYKWAQEQGLLFI